MNELDDFLCEIQSDEFNEDEYLFWSNFQDLGMGVQDHYGRLR